MFSRQKLLSTWKDIRPYFVFAIILFFAGVVIGGTPNAPAAFLEQQLKGLESISNSVRASDNPEATMFWLITLNNVFNTLLVMVLGLIAGIMPIVMLVSNGLVIGFLMSEVASEGHNVWSMVIKGLLPHAFFELSAVFLACAFGMRFGVTLFKGIMGSAMGRERPWQAFSATATGAVPALIAIVALLLIGAVIESTVTYWLMS